MGESNFLFYAVIVIVIGHFIVGFGYLIYKLSPRKEDKKSSKTDEQK